MTETTFDKGAKTDEKFFDVFGKLVWQRRGDHYKEYHKDPAAEKERKEVVDPAFQSRDWLLNRSENSEYLVYRNLILQRRLIDRANADVLDQILPEQQKK